MKIIFIIMILLLSSVCYAVTVGKFTGFENGIVVGGVTGFTGSGSTTIDEVTFGGESVTFGGESVTW